MDEQEFKRRTKDLALRVIELVEELPKTRTAEVLGRQLVRSGTSVGANYRSACRGQIHPRRPGEARNCGRGSRRNRVLAGTSRRSENCSSQPGCRTLERKQRNRCHDSSINQDTADAKVTGKVHRLELTGRLKFSKNPKSKIQNPKFL